MTQAHDGGGPDARAATQLTESTTGSATPNDTAGTPGNRSDTGGKDDTERKPKRSQAAALVTLALKRYRLLVSADDGRTYAVSEDGANVAMPLWSTRGFRPKLARHYAQNNGAVPSSTALSDALTVLEGYAAVREPQPLWLRFGRHGEELVVDLGTADGRCILIEPGQWHRKSRSPVVFRRTKAMLPLPDPIHAGDGLAVLKGLLNLDLEQYRMVVGWIVASWMPQIAHPILKVVGEHGTAKTTLARLVLGLIDPSRAPMRTTPHDVRSWVVSASASWAVGMDNISVIPGWLSDTWCRAVTGEGFVDRALFTDDDVVVIAFRRVIAFTTIDTGAVAGDPGERLLVVEPHLIPASQRRSEEEIEAAFEHAKPAVFASLLDLAAQVLAVLPSVRLASMPRMADFARVLAAVDHVTGWDTLATYLENADTVSADMLATDEFGQAVVAFVRQAGDWTGTSTELLAAVDTPERRPTKWPTNPSQVGGHIRRIAPVLRDHDIDVTEQRVGKNRTRTLRLRAITTAEQEHNSVSAPSAPSAGDADQPKPADSSAGGAEAATDGVGG